MDVSDDESSGGGSSIEATRADAAYYREYYGFDPRDETLLRFEQVAKAVEVVEHRKDSPITRRRCGSLDTVTGDDTYGDDNRIEPTSIAVEQSAPAPFLDCAMRRFDESDVGKLLEAIHPPQEWTENGKFFSRNISKALPVHADAAQLESRLDEMLALRRARPNGVCPLRESIYDDCFNEVIRQVVLASDANCGQLLLRCRDELRYTKEAYRRLFESSESICMRKGLRRDPGGVRKELESSKEELEDVKKEWNDLTEELKKTRKANQEESEKFEKDCKDELDFLNQNNSRLKKVLDLLSKPGGFRMSLDAGIMGKSGEKDADVKARTSEIA